MKLIHGDKCEQESDQVEQPSHVYFVLKLPQGFDQVDIHLLNRTGMETVSIAQAEPIWVNGKWYVELFLWRPDHHLKIHGPGPDNKAG